MLQVSATPVAGSEPVSNVSALPGVEISAILTVQKK